mmetsp:Transcript_20717/g.25089  ORF Transcript_20717/g.25089 Transcript_20717/m.25089 type:complete len:132 (+) Transcript_20717:194-589(+)
MKVFKLVLVALVSFCFFVEDSAALFQVTDFMEEATFEQIRPMLLRAPKALPLLAGKVKSETCKEEGKKVGLKAGKYKDDEMTEEIMVSIVCKGISRDCAQEYVDAGQTLLKLPLVQQMLQLKKGAPVEKNY